MREALWVWRERRDYAKADRLLTALRAKLRKIPHGESAALLETHMRLYRAMGNEAKEYALACKLLSWKPNWHLSSGGGSHFLRRYAELSEKRGLPKEAEKVYRVTMRGYSNPDKRTLPSLNVGIDSPKRLRARALAANSNFLTPTGLTYLRQAVEADAKDPVVRYHLALALLFSQRLTSAEKEFRLVLENRPEDSLRYMTQEKLRYLASFTSKDRLKWDKPR